MKLYLSLVEEFANIAPNDPLAVPDLGWADKKNREVKDEQDKLEHELKSYKNNLIKESIRVSRHNSLAECETANIGRRWATKIWVTSTTRVETIPKHTRHTTECENTVRRTNTSRT